MFIRWNIVSERCMIVVPAKVCSFADELIDGLLRLFGGDAFVDFVVVPIVVCFCCVLVFDCLVCNSNVLFSCVMMRWTYLFGFR